MQRDIWTSSYKTCTCDPFRKRTNAAGKKIKSCTKSANKIKVSIQQLCLTADTNHPTVRQIVGKDIDFRYF